MRLATSPRPHRRTVSNMPCASGFGSNANTGTSIFGGGGAGNPGSTMFGGNTSSSSPFGGGGTWKAYALQSRHSRGKIRLHQQCSHLSAPAFSIAIVVQFCARIHVLKILPRIKRLTFTPRWLRRQHKQQHCLWIETLR